MRTYFNNKNFIFVVFILFNLVSARVIRAQPLHPFTGYNGTIPPVFNTALIYTAPSLFEFTNPNTTPVEYRIGVGNFTLPDNWPTAKLHIKTVLSNTALLKLESSPDQILGGRPDSILFMGTMNNPIFGNLNYGILQTGSNVVKNVFMSKLGIGTIPGPGFMLDVSGNINASGDNYFRNGNCSGWITLTGQNNTIPVIESKQYGLSFYVKGPCGDCITGTFPLMQLTSSENNAVRMVEVSGLLKTQAFQMIPGAGHNKILVGNESGYGVWTDASLFNDNDWLEAPKSKIEEPPGPPVALSLYVNPKYSNVGIGVVHPKSALAVNGKVTAKEFEATLDGWPDYVFDNTYNLRPLKDLENYIQINKHLPEIPTEKEVKEQGVRLGEMNALLVKKVEELTLYIISMQKEIEELKAEHTTK